MFDRFTERARKVMDLATRVARAFQHGSIGTEHLTIGLLGVDDGVSAQVLRNLEIDPRLIRADVERLLVPGTAPASRGQLPVTPCVKRVIDLATESSRGLGHDYIGTEHLLLGLIRDSQAPSGLVMRAVGMEAEVVEAEIRRILSGESTGTPGGSPSGP